MRIDLTALGIKPGRAVVAEARVQIIADTEKGTVILHVDDHLGPLTGPSFDFEVDPIHALHVAGVGVGQVLSNILGKSK